MTWTINKASIEFGVEYQSLCKWMISAGHKLTRAKEFSTKDIARAIYGDAKAERARGEKLENELREIEIAEKLNQLVPIDEVQVMIRDAHLPVKQRLMALPAEMANRCNPSDPQHAREVLQQWIDEALPLVRERLPKPVKDGKDK